ncbi:hypothetical protein [Streptomyces sp. L-9-10]|uniref:hypothetical protein n=1 Tax=unclassified Streptomyces TaxID=2593676 RepID=UPI00101BC313|nr:hypothetical protein [Streptomyces sp. L-9-10]
MDVVIVVALLVAAFVAFVALGVFVSVKAVRAAKRGVDRTISQARRTVEDTTLRAKSIGQTGAAGELAQLRLRLRTSMRATQDALQAGAAEDASLAESVQLFQRLSAHGLELDDELRQLERDPDRTRVVERLQDVRERTERITHAADSLRWAARDRAQKFAEDDLSSLSAQIDMEAGALRHWSSAEGQPEREPSVWPEPEGSGAGAAGADHAGPAGGDQGRPEAIEPPDPRRQQTYPWQKAPGKTRPETTT